MAGDSSFDPLALVKAMGPQRDPYSWAELYAADAAKSANIRDELKNRLLIQEMTRAERAKEGAADRASREGIAKEGRNVARERIAATADNYKKRLEYISKDINWPKGSMTPKEAETKGILNPGEDIGKTHERKTRRGITMVVPIGTEPTILPYTRPPAADPYDDGY